ncbi:hypothetical protein [Alienimonas californiensis]|uniref:Uncharacterized protein n=1 Tax=Alienimonas californiensis TaxID=2527989 RepID=A0A517P5A2_9PLAN|nr:hypothetical protein [Alienimonas californiensis]QDT14544.1 hypothetical protein CA12_06190 [Alienimonas californiensis]
MPDSTTSADPSRSVEPTRPPGPPVTAPRKAKVVRGLLLGGALGGTFGAMNLAVGDVAGLPAGVAIEKPAPGEPERPGENNWHARAARYTGWCVFGGGLIGALSGAAALARDRLRGGADRPPPGFRE